MKMPCYGRLCAACTFAWIAVLMLLFSLGMPWFFYAERTSVEDVGDCDVLLLYSWRTVYCESRGSACTEFAGNVSVCPFKHRDWRTNPEYIFLPPTSPATKTKQVFTYSGVLLAASCVCSIIILLELFLNFCTAKCGENGCLRVTDLLIGLFGLGCLTIVIIGFAVQLPIALKDDGCVNPEPIESKSPCSSFANKYSLDESVFKSTTGWGGAGWIIAVIAWPFLLLSAITACRASHP